jgi:hypothetical protein
MLTYDFFIHLTNTAILITTTVAAGVAADRAVTAIPQK